MSKTYEIVWNSCNVYIDAETGELFSILEIGGKSYSSHNLKVIE